MNSLKFVTDLPKGITGFPDSEELWENILSVIPDSVLLKDDCKILCPCLGHGTEADLLVKRMYKLGISRDKILERIYVLDRYYVFTNRATRKSYKNVIKDNFLTWETSMKFDVIVGNPPFQDGERGDEANKLWPRFVKKSEELIKEGGYVAMVSPNSWMQPTADIGKGNGKNAISIFKNIFKKNNLILANVDSNTIREKYFKNVGSSFSYYIFQKAPYNGDTEFITSDGNVKIDITNIDGLPKVVTKESLSIMKKVTGTPFKFCDQNHGLNGRENSEQGVFTVTRKIKKVEVQEDVNFIYPVYHTNKTNGTYWYSEKLSPYASSPKIIISLSGKYLPVLDSKHGYSNMCLALICKTEDEAKRAHFILSSKLYRFLVEMQKFSGFNPRKQILNLPSLDLSKDWNDASIYKHFNLTQEEIDFIEAQ